MSEDDGRKRYLSTPVVLVSLAATLIGTIFFWKLLEALQARGLYTIGPYKDKGEYSDISVWVCNGIVVFFVVLIAVVARRTGRRK